MNGKKLSVAIPYKQRLENLAIVFEALADQTMDRSEFEVVVGAMEYCDQYTALCKRFVDRIDIVSVMSSSEFSIPRARNLAMRQASGGVVVQMDADTLLPPTALQNLYDRHFAFGQQICVVGQVVGYGNNNDGDIDSVEPQPYAKYRDALKELGDTKGNPRDPRFKVSHVIPWAFGWTGLIALPLDTVRRHGLFFDEEFHGWGVDDLEWSYRICESRTPIVLCEDVYAIHLPHARDTSANRKTERQNYGRFLRKWPRADVELAHAFGDVQANSLFLDFKQELRRVSGGDGRTLGCVRGNVGRKDVLLVGARLDDRQRMMETDLCGLWDEGSKVEVLPLLGMALPYGDKAVQECRVLPSISQLDARYGNAVRAELERISNCVIPTDTA